MTGKEVFEGSNGEETRAYYDRLERCGPAGVIGMNLFRACKASTRAKMYRGRSGRSGESFRALAYQKKQWSMKLLAEALEAEGLRLGMRWGWKEDRAQDFHNQVLYVDLPEGQVSFHTERREGSGPEYEGEWDGERKSTERIIGYCERILGEPREPAQMGLGRMLGVEEG